MKLALGIAVAGLAPGILGCAPAWQTQAPITPSSYAVSSERVPRTVGKLRKLVAVSVIQPAPKECLGGGGNPVFVYNALSREFIQYLRETKGYEIAASDDADSWSSKGDSSRRAKIEELVSVVAGGGHASPSLAAKNLVAELSRAEKADGVLLFRSYESCMRDSVVLRAILGVASLGVSEIVPGDTAKAFPWIETSIMEAATGQIVWQKVRSLPLYRHSDAAKNNTDAELFFDDLEYAVPKVLTK